MSNPKIPRSMKMKLKKAYRDLSADIRKTLLVIFALALGVWGVGTVLVAYSILSKDLDANYQSTSPLHAVLYSDDFGKTTLEEIVNSPDVAAAEFRDFSLNRIEVSPDVWLPLWLFGGDDFDNFRLAEFFYEEGDKTPERGTILIERDSRKIADIDTGSTVRINVGDSIRNVRISGITFDPALAPAKQDLFIYAYTDRQTFHEMTGIPLDTRLIVRFNDVHSGEDVRQKTKKLSAELEAVGISVGEVEIPIFNEHPHQWQLNTLLFLIGSIGLLAFLMGAVLVSQLMKSILASQTRQVGIMKSIGATRRMVFQIYISMLLLIGLVAGLIAIPLAVMSGNGFNGLVAGQLNFNILTTTVPAWAYIVLVLFSLLSPVIFSLPMLLKGTRIPVKEALSDYGVSNMGTGGKTMPFKHIKLSGLTLLAIRNSGRNMRRLSVTILTMALGVAIFSTGFNVRQSLWNLLSSTDEELKYDIQVALKHPAPASEVAPLFADIPNLQRVESWVGGQIEGKIKMISTDNGAVVVAVPMATEQLNLNIIEGRSFSSDKLEVVMNNTAWMLYGRPAIGVEIGIAIDGERANAILSGIAKQYEKPRVFFNIDQYNKHFNRDTSINTLVFAAKDREYDNVLQMKKDIEQVVAASGLDVIYVMSQAERVKIIYDHLNIILYTIVMLSFLVLVVSAIGMASATGINIMERTREIGIMRAIGAIPKQIYRLFVSEGTIVSILSIVIGLILAYPVSRAAALFFGKLMLGEEATLEYAFSHTGFVVTLVITFLFGWLASRIPAKSAIKVSTRGALAYE